ncbi:MAG: outer membrane beta-barrel protein [Burkholderiaceae bacterium]
MNVPFAVRNPVLLAALLLASPLATAADPGWYVGAGVGQSRAKIADDRIASGLLGSGLLMPSIDDDRHDVGFKLFGGYQFDRHFSVEGGYFDLGKFGFDATTNPAGTLSGSIRLRGVDLDLVATLPVTDRFSVFGRAGATYVQARDSFSGSGAVVVSTPNPRKSAANYKFGVGIAYAATDAIDLRAEAERYRVDDAVHNKGDIDLLSVGLVYRFGAKTPTPAPRIAAAAPVAITPPPSPPPAPLPPPPSPPPSRMTLSADSLFDFDRATIKPSGAESLDRLATALQDVRYDRLTVTGHTDRLGPQAYNQRLSASRAEAVKTYLVRHGVAADRIEARGVDGAEPVTTPEQCKGSRPTRALIACLQPDRRVEVEASATK